MPYPSSITFSFFFFLFSFFRPLSFFSRFLAALGRINVVNEACGELRRATNKDSISSHDFLDTLARSRGSYYF